MLHNIPNDLYVRDVTKTKNRLAPVQGTCTHTQVYCNISFKMPVIKQMMTSERKVYILNFGEGMNTFKPLPHQ